MTNSFLRNSLPRHALSLALLCAGIALPSRSDEGMWLFSDPPREQLKAKHGFDVSDAWLEHLQKSSVRFMSGGSGSFVSADGLVMSNHHVAADALQKLSTAQRDLLKEGFYARTLAEEVPCKDLELNVLVSIEDVTARVNAAVPATATPEEANRARRAVMSTIEKESLDKTGLRSDVVALYQGGAYHLYRYKRYTDVRLVFAPEQQIAFFGGDPDNFEYPRFDLDVAFVRAYENGKPAKVEHFLRWSTAGTKDGDLVFVSGHPGRTQRLLTVTELEYIRDHTQPETLERLYREEVSLLAWSARSAENARRAKDELFGIQNSRKARVGGLGGLQDPQFFARIAAAEQAFRARLNEPRFEKARAAFDRIAGAQQVLAGIAWRHRLLETGWGLRSDLFHAGRTLLRAADERGKPNGDRLREFRDSNLASLELDLLSTRPVYEDLEIVQLSDSLAFLASKLGATDPLVQIALAGKSPAARAAELVKGTKLKDVEVRKRLYAGDAAAVRAAADPMIELARALDTEARSLQKTVEEQQEIKRQAHGDIARARFELQGTGSYPDATFTLRLSYGLVKGYEENGQPVPAFTQMSGLYERAASQHFQPPFDLPARWIKRKSRVDLTTPFNFVTTADIIGGNSGSPTVDRQGNVVGLIFDGNLQSLVLDFAYDDVVARALSVDVRAILGSLRRVYDAQGLADELTGKRGPRG